MYYTQIAVKEKTWIARLYPKLAYTRKAVRVARIVAKWNTKTSVNGCSSRRRGRRRRKERRSRRQKSQFFIFTMRRSCVFTWQDVDFLKISAHFGNTCFSSVCGMQGLYFYFRSDHPKTEISFSESKDGLVTESRFELNLLLHTVYQRRQYVKK